MAAGFAEWLFRDLVRATRYPGYLLRTELFQSYGPARTSAAGRTVAAALTAPLRGPLQLLWLPAVVALVSWPAWLWRCTIVAAVISFGALVIAGIDDRFDAMWRLLQGGLFRGAALAVSLLVIVLAAARLLGISYVTTILDSAAATIILFLLASLYILSWWAGYWIARLLSQCILAVVAGGPIRQGIIPYQVCRSRTSVPADRRVLQIHGASRFLALRENNGGCPWFQAHSADSLIGLLADSGAPGGKAEPLPSQIRARAQTYVALVTTFLVLLGGAGIYALHKGEQSSELKINAARSSDVHLQTLLFDGARQSDGRPVIVMAASGGGTRAALFVASVLRALWKQHAAADVALGSGISGGGAALAYFASNRQELVNAANDKPWDRYIAAMSEPFIQDVLTKATEWRMAGPGRLGMLLDESFRNRWHLPQNRRTLGSIDDFGLILNTSIAGHLDCADTGHCGEPLIELDRRYPKATRSELAGGRLILTNLKFDQPLALPSPEGKSSHDLPVVTNDPDTRVETAAALNANFPPVFSDAAIDVDEVTRYWVTDGGAIDNRGMETLLYALRQVLARNAKQHLPRMIVLIADASGFSPLFTQDRGSAAALSAGSKMTSQLSSELIASIQRLYCSAKQPGDFGFAYLLMPDELRTSDSFGTHWMLQPLIKVKHQQPPGETSEVTLKGPEMVQVLRYLYTDESPAALSADARTVLGWARKAKSPWKDLTTGLTKGGILPNSGAESCNEALR